MALQKYDMELTSEGCVPVYPGWDSRGVELGVGGGVLLGWEGQTGLQKHWQWAGPRAKAQLQALALALAGGSGHGQRQRQREG